MKIHATRCPKAGSGIPLKLGFALKRTGGPFSGDVYDGHFGAVASISRMSKGCGSRPLANAR